MPETIKKTDLLNDIVDIAIMGSVMFIIAAVVALNTFNVSEAAQFQATDNPLLQSWLIWREFVVDFYSLAIYIGKLILPI